MKLKHNTVFLIASRVTVDSSQIWYYTLSCSPTMAPQAQEEHGCTVSLPCKTLLRSKAQFMPLLPPEHVAAAGWRGELAVGHSEPQPSVPCPCPSWKKAHASKGPSK